MKKKPRVETADVDVTEAVEAATTNRLTIAFLARQHGKDPKLVYQRIRKNWPIERALTEPSRTHAPAVTLQRLADERGVSPESLVKSLLKGVKRKVS